jgi:fatty acid desaturase
VTLETTMRIRPWFFPLAAILLITASCLTAPMGAVVSWTLLLMAARAQSLALHIWVHESVHHPAADASLRWIHEMAMSLLMGQPFEGYRGHHLDHHRHGNSLDDVSSTWKRGAHGPEPMTWWGYSLAWPVQAVRTYRIMRGERRHSLVGLMAYRRMRVQLASIAGFLLVLAVCDVGVLARYLVLIYAGWTLTCVHSYGQHPPVHGRTDWITSQQDFLYNLLMCNNGLHFEHHANPSVPWDRLEVDDEAPSIAQAHLLHAFEGVELVQEVGALGSDARKAA